MNFNELRKDISQHNERALVTWQELANGALNHMSEGWAASAAKFDDCGGIYVFFTSKDGRRQEFSLDSDGLPTAGLVHIDTEDRPFNVNGFFASYDKGIEVSHRRDLWNRNPAIREAFGRRVSAQTIARWVMRFAMNSELCSEAVEVIVTAESKGWKRPSPNELYASARVYLNYAREARAYLDMQEA